MPKGGKHPALHRLGKNIVSSPSARCGILGNPFAQGLIDAGLPAFAGRAEIFDHIRREAQPQMDLGDLGFGTANTPGRRQKGIIDLDRVLIRDNARIDRSIFFGCGEDGPGFKLRHIFLRLCHWPCATKSRGRCHYEWYTPSQKDAGRYNQARHTVLGTIGGVLDGIEHRLHV